MLQEDIKLFFCAFYNNLRGFDCKRIILGMKNKPVKT